MFNRDKGSLAQRKHRNGWIAAIALGSLGFPALAQAQAIPQPAVFNSVTLNRQFSPDPMTLKGVSGGSVAASRTAGRTETATGPCVGFMEENPNHTLTLTEFFGYLSLKVESTEDTTLVIKGPGGSWCNDDYEGKNPGIAGQWLPGTYQVWVGSYQPKQFHPYTIKLSEVR